MNPLRSFSAARFWRSLALAGLCLATGCATSPRTGQSKSPIFYPTAPEEPRLQFLTSYSGGGDLEGGQNKFAAFVAGKEVVKKPLLKPYGVAIHDGKLYVCDMGAGVVQILDLEKQIMRPFVPKGGGKLRLPINLAIDTDGTCYIVDANRNQVLIYASDGSFIASIGQNETAKAVPLAPPASDVPPAKDAMLEMRPTDVAVTADRIYVTDLKNRCVRVYDKLSRNLLFTVPGDSSKEDGARLFAPTNLALDAQGKIYVSDLGAFRVQAYDLKGKYLRTIGKSGDAPGEFVRPKGIAVDRAGHVYVVDAASQVIQIFDEEGRLMLYFGQSEASEASEALLDLPAKVAIDYDNVRFFQSYVAPHFQLEYLVFVTNQLGLNKVSVYGYGHRQP